MLGDNEIRDPESDNVVRFTDNGPKDGDLKGINPYGLTVEEVQEALDALISGDAKCQQ